MRPADAPSDFGFVRVAAAVPPLKVADIAHNLEQILAFARSAPTTRACSCSSSPSSASPATPRAISSTSTCCSSAPPRPCSRSPMPPLTSAPAHRRLPARRRRRAVQHGGRRLRRRRARPRAEDVHPRLQGVLRGAVVRLVARPAEPRGAARPAPRAGRDRPALPRPRLADAGHRRRDLRGPLGSAAAQLLPGAARRAPHRQPVGLERTGRQGRLPALARRAAVGPRRSAATSTPPAASASRRRTWSSAATR